MQSQQFYLPTGISDYVAYPQYSNFSSQPSGGNSAVFRQFGGQSAEVVKAPNNSKKRRKISSRGEMRSIANVRERRRTQALNDAFATLRKCILEQCGNSKIDKLKSAKIATLQLAVQHIQFLHEQLFTITNKPKNYPSANLSQEQIYHESLTPSGQETFQTLPFF